MSRPANYGPWATTLDDEPASRLDTFWQRRMAMLPELNRTSSRVRARTRTCLAVLTMAALAAPLVYLSRPTAVGADDAAPFGGAAQVPEPSAEFLPPLSDNEKKIGAALDNPTTLDFTEAPLSDVVDYLADLHAIPIKIHTRSIDDAGIGADAPLTANLQGISLRSALRLALDKLDLTYAVADEVLLITTNDHASGLLITRVYPVGDLYDETSPELATTIRDTVQPLTWEEEGGNGRLAIVSNSKSLVISQTHAVHEEILQLLRALRAAKAGAGGGTASK